MAEQLPFQNNQGLFVDVDCLYDTRLASLEQIDPRLALEALVANYTTRQEDVFPLIDRDTFRQLYRTRTNSTLLIAAPTQMFTVMQNFIRACTDQNIKSPFRGRIDVYVNLYPYRLTKEQAQAFLKPVAEICGHVANVHVVNYSDEQITPKFLRKNISLLIKYDYASWLDHVAKNESIKHHQVPDVQFMVPELYFERKPTEEEINEIKRNNQDPFRQLREISAGLIGLEFVPIEYYCAEFPDQFIVKYRQDLAA